MKDYASFFYPETRFSGFTNIDGTINFYIRVNSFISSSSIVLDVGCGRGSYMGDPVSVRRELRIIKGKCKKVIGIDTDKTARENPCIDDFRLIEGSSWPVEDGFIDVCICDNVLEHIVEPENFFSECRRVIKQGGYLCIRTPNLLSYFGLFSKLIPNRLHCKTVTKIQNIRESQDVFPVFYRCNTKKRVSNMFKKYCFDACVLGYESEPSYLSFSLISYFLGVAHQRFTPNMFKVAIFGFGRKI